MLGSELAEFSGDGEEVITVFVGFDIALAQERLEVRPCPAGVVTVFVPVDSSSDLLCGVEDTGCLLEHLIDFLFHWVVGRRLADLIVGG